MTEHHLALLSFYDTKKSLANSSGFYTTIACLILVCLSRSPSFTLEGELFGIGDNLHCGYITTYGPIAILFLVGWYASRLHTCLETFKATRTLIQQGATGVTGGNALDNTVLRPPHDQALMAGSSSFAKVFDWSARRVPLFVAASSYILMISEYFQFTIDQDGTSWPWAILLGHPGVGQGFKAHWDRFNGGKDDMLMVYPPYATVILLLGMVLLLYLLVSIPKRIDAASSSPHSA